MFPPNSLRKDQQLDSLALDDKVDQRMYERVWGKWLGHEEEFYKKTARMVNALDWNDVLSIGGTEIKVRDRLVRDSYSQLLSEHLPPVLKRGSMNVLGMDQESCRVTTYSPIDPIDLPHGLIAVLPYFDGRPTQEAVEAIETHEGVRLEPALVRKLADFEVLIPG